MSRAKEAAGRHAARFVESGMTVGLGTGSTVFFTLKALAERIREEGLELRGVPTSVDTETKAKDMGIPLVPLDDVTRIDVTIDGADEIDGDFAMIKGGGGALLREKVIASLSEREVIVVHREKVVEELGRGFLLPVEVIPFARPAVIHHLSGLGATPTLRMSTPDQSYCTDNGNEILDCRFEGGIPSAAELDLQLNAIPGVVENGLFVGLANVLVIGDDDGGVEVREKG
ncbi:MAG TPA: ribose-5-phosphate isomerase RpiA [Planctomycetes bacterium]|nr:ribose-5-phosphate isomerase RpiA [Planctomycetota bacterium]